MEQQNEINNESESNNEGDKTNPETNDQDKPQAPAVEFKKPIFIGKIGKLPTKVVKKSDESKPIEEKTDDPSKITNESSPADDQPQTNTPKPYKEPAWSDIPPPGYYFEVLKSGMILDNIKLEDKAYFTCGKLPSNDIVMAHPTISRHHAIIQYKAHSGTEKFPVGFYLYDLGSSHGTFINKIKIKPHHYARIKVGHLLKVGCSTRQYIFQGPEEDDADKESELSLTEMKELRKAKILDAQQRIAEEMERKKQLEEAEKKKEEEGISWGMADDAEEESDLSENPFAQTTNEELYLDDPKKTLRGFFEREGENLEYDCQERGVGQFVCRVELPVEDARGNPVIAEVIHKGKKKEAVIQCALEACRILDRCGVLRQAKHESRQKKAKNWKDDDYYDSDDDTFFDRTGSIEKKRQHRIKKYGELADNSEDDKSEADSNKPLTYDTLLEQCNQINKQISSCETKLADLRKKTRPEKSNDNSNDEVDVLDAFMNDLKKQGPSIADKAEISKLKLEIANLKGQLAKAEKLAQIAKPTDLPALVKPVEPKTPIIKKTQSVLIGKRLKIQSRQQTPFKKQKVEENESEQFEEEVESEDEDDKDSETVESKDSKTVESELKVDKEEKSKEKVAKSYGPMRPPTNYVMPENYFEQVNDRDLPEIIDEDY